MTIGNNSFSAEMNAAMFLLHLVVASCSELAELRIALNLFGVHSFSVTNVSMRDNGKKERKRRGGTLKQCEKRASLKVPLNPAEKLP